MNIGVFFKHEKSGGGIYQYFLALMECLKSFNDDRFFLFHSHELELLSKYRKTGIKTIALENHRNASHVPHSTRHLDASYEAIHNGKKVFFRTRSLTSELKSKAESHNIDLMLYPTPERESFEIGIPYIMVIHDVAHLLHSEFKEFSADGIYDQREYINSNGLEQAFLVIADSETGKDQLVRSYSTDPSKIKVLPYIPPPYIFENGNEDKIKEVREKYHFPDDIIFYPAQFWPHKNHENLIKAIYLLKKNREQIVTALFVGSKQERWNGFEKMTRLAKGLNVQSQIIYLGYVEPEYMPALYKMAKALVMPTYQGSTNIPILEAFVMGCPVVTSDFAGIRDQVGDAGILVNPDKPEEISKAISRIWNDDKLRCTLSKKGHEKINLWTRTDFTERLSEIINTYKENVLNIR